MHTRQFRTYLNYGLVFNYPFKLNNNVESTLEIYACTQFTMFATKKTPPHTPQKHNTIFATTQFKVIFSLSSRFKGFWKKRQIQNAPLPLSMRWEKGENSFKPWMSARKSRSLHAFCSMYSTSWLTAIHKIVAIHIQLN